MTMQVVDKKTNTAIPTHPLQHKHQFFFSKMVAKQGGKNDVGFLIKENFFVIG